MPKVVVEFDFQDDTEGADETVASLNNKSDCWEALADLARTDIKFKAWLAPAQRVVR